MKNRSALLFVLTSILAITVSTLVAAAPPVEVHQKVLHLSAEQVRTLQSSPVEILPAKPGVFYDIQAGLFSKDGAAAFTTIAQNVQVQYKSTPQVNGLAFSYQLLSASTTTIHYQRPSVSHRIDDQDPASFGGKGLELNLSADVQDGAPCTLVLWYTEVPVSAFMSYGQ